MLPRPDPPSKSRSLQICVVAYLVAGLTAVGIASLWPSEHPLELGLVADITGTLVIFLFSRALRNSSLYDAYWSVLPAPLVAYWALSPLSPEVAPIRSALVMGLVVFWSVRLTYSWARGWSGLDHEDWRYEMLAEKSGKAYPLVDLFGIHLFPTVQVFAGCLGAYVAVSLATRPLGWMDGVASAVTATAVWVEMRADKQLHDFTRTKKPGEILATGLWAYSRHPNYFGEVLFWWGLYLFSVAAAPELWWTLIGPVMITMMFVFVSIPMIDERSRQRRPGYAEHMNKVSPLIPLPRSIDD